MFHSMAAANKAVERHFLTSWDRREEQEMIGLQGAEIHSFLQGSNFLQVFRVRLA